MLKDKNYINKKGKNLFLESVSFKKKTKEKQKLLLYWSTASAVDTFSSQNRDKVS